MRSLEIVVGGEVLGVVGDGRDEMVAECFVEGCDWSRADDSLADVSGLLVGHLVDQHGCG